MTVTNIFENDYTTLKQVIYLVIVYTKSKIALKYQKSANHTKKNEKCPLSLGEHYYVIKLHNLPLHLSNLKLLS